MSNLSVKLFLFAFVLGSPFEVNSQSGWFSQDSGVSEHLYSVFFVNGDFGVAVGEAGTILKTMDGGANWQKVSAPTSEDLNAVYFFDADSGVIAGNAGLLLRSSDGATTWSPVTTDVGQHLYAVSFHGAQGICGGTLLSILTSSDAGRSWNVFQSGLFGGPFNGAHMISDSVGYLVGVNAAFQPFVAKTSDRGQSWNFTAFLVANHEGELLDVRFLDENTGFAVSRLANGQGGISRTGDGGVNWIHSIFEHGLYGIDFPSDRIGFAVGLSGTIMKTADGGQTWFDLASGLSNSLRSVAFVDTLIGFVVGDEGTILKTTTGGEVLTSIEGANHGADIPDEFQLLGNFPYPFNPSTSIVFGLPRTSVVRLQIYNLRGRPVRTLLDATLAAGFHSVNWDGTDDGGSVVASGWYVYSLQTSGQTYSKRMLLLR